MICYIRIRCTDDIFQCILLSCNDQIFQIDSTIELIILIYYVNSRYIVIFTRLPDQFSHGLADGQILMDHNKIGCHQTTDFIILIRLQHLNVMAGFLIHHADQFFLGGIIQLIQDIHCIVRVHVRQHLCCLSKIQFLQVFIRIFNISKNLSNPFRSQQRI